MKRFFTLSCVLLVPALLLAGSSIKFKSTTIDFGEMESGKIADLNFEFTNGGNSQLILKSINPSCGCTTTDMKKMTFAPGEKGSIPIKFNTLGYNGRVTKMVTVMSNDTETPEVRLIINGMVTMKDFAKAGIDPEQLAFGRVQAGKSYTRKVILSNSGNQELRVIEICSPPEAGLVFSNRIVAPGMRAEVTVTFTPFDKGTYNSLIKIRTTDPKRAFIFVRMDAEVE